MILSDQKYYCYFETGISWDYANNCHYMPIFTVFSLYFLKVFCKCSWSAYNNITYTEICQNLF